MKFLELNVKVLKLILKGYNFFSFDEKQRSQAIKSMGLPLMRSSMCVCVEKTDIYAYGMSGNLNLMHKRRYK